MISKHVIQRSNHIFTILNIFSLDVNFDKSIVGLQFLLISFILENFQDDKKLITMLSIMLGGPQFDPLQPL